jgi:phage tail-like protein
MMKKIQKLLAVLLILKAFAVRTVADDPLQKMKFRVTIPGLPTGLGFQKVSGLNSEYEVVEYLEGLYEHAHKLPGRQKVGEVTLERGTYSTNEMMDLYKSTLTSANMRNTVIVEVMDKYNNPVKTYKLAEAWVSKWEGSDLDATSSDVAIEKITLQFEYFLD